MLRNNELLANPLSFEEQAKLIILVTLCRAFLLLITLLVSAGVIYWIFDIKIHNINIIFDNSNEINNFFSIPPK